MLAAALSGLSGCGSDGLADLREYVDRIKARKQGHVEPLPEIRSFESFFYTAEGLRDPFLPEEGPSEPTLAAADTGIRPDTNRRREELESFSLDTLRMVGTLMQDDETWAVVLATNGTIHRVQRGNYMGTNHGRVNQITENKIELTEIVPDGLGGWRERDASLALNNEE